MWATVASYLFGAGLTATQLLFGSLGMLSCLVVYARFARSFEAVIAISFWAVGSKSIFDDVKELRI